MLVGSASSIPVYRTPGRQDPDPHKARSASWIKPTIRGREVLQLLAFCMTSLLQRWLDAFRRVMQHVADIALSLKSL